MEISPQRFVCAQIFPWSANRVSPVMSGYYNVVRDDKKLQKSQTRFSHSWQTLLRKCQNTSNTRQLQLHGVIHRPTIACWSFSVLKAHTERLKSENVIIRSINQSCFIIENMLCSTTFVGKLILSRCASRHLFAHWIVSALQHLLSLLTPTCRQKQRKNIICLWDGCC